MHGAPRFAAKRIGSEAVRPGFLSVSRCGIAAPAPARRNSALYIQHFLVFQMLAIIFLLTK